VTGYPGLLLAAALVLGNGFFVGVEFALLAARQTALTRQSETSARARRALHASKRLPLMIAGCQFGITLCSLGLGAVGEPALAHVLDPGLDAVGIPEGALHPISFALALTLMSAAHMLLGEMVPKNLALAAPERSAVLLAPVLLAFIAAFRPVIAGLTAAAAQVLKLFGVALVDESSASYTPDQIGHLVDAARQAGLLGRHEHQRLTGALAFDRGTVHDVMVTLDAVVSVPSDVTAAGLEDVVGRTGFSRFPVSRGDAWVGYLHLADALTRSKKLTPRDLPAVQADTPLREVLTLLQRTGAHLGEVRDGDDRVGLVMLEDVLEQLVGEVQDSNAR
jgi:CBS domain containing-hemolysin-like protein